MAQPSTSSGALGRPRALAVLAVAVGLLAASVLGAGCSSDGSDGAKAGSGADGTTTAPKRTTTTAPRTTTTAAPSTTTSTKPATTPGSGGAGGSSAYAGDLDGQDGVSVSFTRTASALTDLRADGLELTCQPLASGDAKTITVDVAMAQVPLGTGGLVEFTESGAPYEPTVSGSFTASGDFAGSLYLSGQRDGYACGGEFTFIATSP